MVGEVYVIRDLRMEELTVAAPYAYLLGTVRKEACYLVGVQPSEGTAFTQSYVHFQVWSSERYSSAVLRSRTFCGVSRL